MKYCPQIYVRGSVEAVDFYIKAFNGALGFNVRHEDGTYAHASIMVGDDEILALCENECYTSETVRTHPVMQFNIYDMVTKETVLNAYQVLSEGAVENENPDGPTPPPWDPNGYSFSLIDKYNIWWGIALY